MSCAPKSGQGTAPVTGDARYEPDKIVTRQSKGRPGEDPLKDLVVRLVSSAGILGKD